MNLEKGRITGRQFAFLLAGFIQGSIFLLSFVTNLTKHDTWLALLAAVTLIIPYTAVYFTISKKFPDKNIIQINDEVFGRYLGKIISLYYIIYFNIILSLNLKDLGGFYSSYLIQDQPVDYFTVVFIAVLSYLLWKGIENLARLAYLFVGAAYFIIVSTTLMLMPQMQLSNFLPVFDVSVKDFVKGAHLIASLPYAEMITFLMITPAVNDKKSLVKNAYLGLSLASVSFFIVVFRDTAVLGNLEPILASPAFEAVRLINITGIFTRMDILIGVGNTLLVFLKCGVFFYASVLSVAQFCGLKDYKTVIFPLGVLSVVLASALYESTIDNMVVTQITEILSTMMLQFIIPPVTLLVAKLRKLPGREAVKN
ncbi:MAG: endospore germination permease [Bacillota bacterium]|nr:endospore germination permease [Bacillota bacterium]